MTKTVSALRKRTAHAAVAKKRQTTAKKLRELPAAEQRARIHAFIDEVGDFWKGQPSTGSVDFLIKLRRGA